MSWNDVQCIHTESHMRAMLTHRDHDTIQRSSHTERPYQSPPTPAALTAKLLTAHQPNGKPCTTINNNNNDNDDDNNNNNSN